MAVTLTAVQQGTGVSLVWETDGADPAAGWEIKRSTGAGSTPSVALATVGGTWREFVDGTVDEGETYVYRVTDLDLADDSPDVEIEVSALARWCTIDLVRSLLKGLSPNFTDEQVDEAIVIATARLDSQFCTPVTIDSATGLPTDFNVQLATATMAARYLTASPPTTGGGDLTSERIGGYAYTTKSGDGDVNAALTVDESIADLVGGYLCGGGSSGVPFSLNIGVREDDVIVHGGLVESEV